MNCGEVIRLLSKFPEDKPVKVLACGNDYSDDLPDIEEIDSISYPLEFNDEYDDEGNPLFDVDEGMVCIFTKGYTDMMLLNGV